MKKDVSIIVTVKKKTIQETVSCARIFFILFSLTDQYFALHRDIVNDKTSAKQA